MFCYCYIMHICCYIWISCVNVLMLIKLFWFVDDYFCYVLYLFHVILPCYLVTTLVFISRMNRQRPLKVVLSKKDFLVVYRGCNHQLTTKGSPSLRTNRFEMNRVELATKGDIFRVESNHSSSEMLNWNADHKDSISTGIQDVNCQLVNGSL